MMANKSHTHSLTLTNMCAHANAQKGSESCTACLAGTYSVSAAKDCVVCDRAKFSNSSKATGCFSCAAGTVQPSVNETQCIECPEGKYENGKDKECKLCESGRFNSEPGKDKDCFDCAEGEVQTKASSFFFLKKEKTLPVPDSCH